jgi:hypothetical protein
MGMVCYLRQISPSELAEIEAHPARTYELVLGPRGTDARPSSEEALELVNALHQRYAPMLDRIRQANANRVSISEEDKATHKQWLNEYKALTAPWSKRNRRKIGPTESDVSELGIDKSWHGIHFLLTGQSEGGNPPYSLAILGGKEVPDPEGLMSFGPALKVSSEEVREVAEALATISAHDLLARYDAVQIVRHEIYAAGQDAQEDREYFSHFYEKVRAFYGDAAKKGNGMLVYLA